MWRLFLKSTKFVLQVLPDGIRGRLRRASSLVSWYRKKLNHHYHESFLLNSTYKEALYQKWIEQKEPSLWSSSCDRRALTPRLIILLELDAGDFGLLARTAASIKSLPVHLAQVIIRLPEDRDDIDEKEVFEILEPLNFSLVTEFRTEQLNTDQDQFITFLSCGDQLSQHTVDELTHALEQMPEATLVYADSDLVDSEGKRSAPSFCPDWNKDLFLTSNYFKHNVFWHLNSLACYQGELSGTHAFALSLTCLEAKERVAHINKVLFHRSQAHDLKGIEYLAQGAKRLFEFLKGEVSDVLHGESAGTFQLKWKLPELPPKVTLIIPTRNAKKLVQVCINSILEKTDYPNYEIVLVDNQSDEREALDYFDKLSSHPKIRVIQYNNPFNYSAINNYAVAHTKGELVALVNNDIEVINPGWLTEMVSQACRNDVGCVGAKLYYSDDMIQHAGVVIGYGGVAGHAHKNFPMKHPGYMNRLKVAQNYSAVTAACLLVRRSIYEEVKGLNEKELTVAFNDVDFCLKVKAAGYRNVWTPHARLYHHESVSRGSDQSGEKRKRFLKEIDYMKQTWHTDHFNDPAYNANLTLHREDFSVDPESLL